METTRFKKPGWSMTAPSAAIVSRANGWGGQKIIVLPELNSVVVFTGANFTKKVKQYEIFERYLLPAIIN